MSPDTRQGKENNTQTSANARYQAKGYLFTDADTKYTHGLIYIMKFNKTGKIFF
jgi:hypothetical protein